jgi:hypothetical protein
MNSFSERVKAIQGIVIDPEEIIYLVREKMKLHKRSLDLKWEMDW